MATRTWAGGTHSFDDAANWSPPGVPVPGDTLLIQSGTATADYQALTGYQIKLGALFSQPSPSLLVHDVEFGSDTTLSSGFIYAPPAIPIPAAANGVLQAEGYNLNRGLIEALGPGRPYNGGTLTLAISDDGTSGAERGIFNNLGTLQSISRGTLDLVAQSSDALLLNGGLVRSTGGFDTVDIGVPVLGDGTLEVSGFGASIGQMILESGVSADQNLQFDGGYAVIAEPGQFHALIHGFVQTPSTAPPELILRDAQVTAYTVSDDVLTLMNGSDEVARLRFGDYRYTAQNFQVVSSGGDTVITPQGSPEAIPSEPAEPAISAPSGEQVPAGGTIQISNVWVADRFAASTPGTMALNISASSGAIQLSTPGGAPLPGSGTHYIQYVGTFAQVNAALQRLTYTADGVGSDTLTVNVWDQAGRSTTTTIPIGVTAQGPATRSFVGGNHDVLDADAWTPAGVPEAGDLLQVFIGTATMKGGDLSGNTLVLGDRYTESPPQTLPHPVLAMSDGAMLDTLRFEPLGINGGAAVQVSGQDTIRDLDLEGGYPGGTLDVNLDDYALLHTTVRNGELVTSRAVLHVTGGSNAALSNDGPSLIYAADIEANVVGSGSWTIYFPNTGLTFGRAVSAAQSINLEGNSSLEVRDPADFQAIVNLGAANANTVRLDGIHGDAFTYEDDTLRISSGGSLVDTLRLHEPAGAGFVITDHPAGIVIAGMPVPQESSGVIVHISS